MISVLGGVGGVSWGTPCFAKIGTALRRELKNETCAVMMCYKGSNMAAHVCHIKSMFCYVSKIRKKWVLYLFLPSGLKCVEIIQEGILVRKLRHEFLRGKNNLHPNRFRDEKVYVMTQLFLSLSCVSPPSLLRVFNNIFMKFLQNVFK